MSRLSVVMRRPSTDSNEGEKMMRAMRTISMLLLTGIVLTSLCMAAEREHERKNDRDEVLSSIDADLTAAVNRAITAQFCFRLTSGTQPLGGPTRTGRGGATTNPQVAIPEICTNPAPDTVDEVACWPGGQCFCDTNKECSCLAEVCPHGSSLPGGGGAAQCDGIVATLKALACNFR
jgi:hypothetical protein